MKNKIFVSALSLCLLFLNATAVSADVQINNSYKSPIAQSSDISKLISSFSSNAVIVAGVVFLILVIIAGYHMLSNSGNSEKFSAGKDIITYALMGFLLIFGAYWIIQLLQFMLGLSNTDARIVQ